MVAKAARDRRSSSLAKATAPTSTTTRQTRLSSASHDKKKTAKPIGICGFCLGDNEKNANGVPEEMIHCAECGNSGHPSCLQYSEKLVKKIRTIHWQCIDCKRCIVCNKSDDSLLFCDFCDSGIHPKCCNPPLNNIPKGDFACHGCHDEIMSSSNKNLSLSSSSSSSTRSRRSNASINNNTSEVVSDSIAQVDDSMTNYCLPNKSNYNNIRQQSIQKAMKYLRENKTLKSSNKKLLKRLHSTNIIKENHQSLAKTITNSSKTQRIRKKLLQDDLCSNPQTSTPLITRQLSNKKSFTNESLTSQPLHPIEELSKTPLLRSTTNKRKHSTISLSPISTTSSIVKKRTKDESSVKKHHSNINSNKQKESLTEDNQSDDEKQIQSTGAKRKLHLDLSKYKNPPAFIKDTLPDNIVENDVYLFLESRKDSTKLITDYSDKFNNSSEPIEDDGTNTRWPPYIVFGSDLIKTWYSSSYPQEYARVPRLYICEFCLKYMKCEQVYDRHCKKCIACHPPANEIYHKDDLSVFEVDGNVNRIYCQNLCLLAKLFLDHKTLYYDVEPFLFYVLTKNDSNGCHFIGYFSKEKHCPQKYNLSCITVLPNCQRRGYGRFLIELSYLLSQKEGQVGTPERPLSTLGAQTYESYWKIKIIEQLLMYYNENKQKCLLKMIMNETGMACDDIIETLQNLGVLTMKSNGKPVITADITQLETILKNDKIKHAHWVSIDSEYLRFTPVLTPLLLTNEEKAVEKEVKEIQIVFKQIGREAAEAALLEAESNDGSNPTEIIRYIRRRKYGQKRRSIIVKRRTPMNNKSNKNESIITNDDSCTIDTTINDIDEHSQEYKPRRQFSIIHETIEQEENKSISPTPSLKLTLKQSTFKQLQLDQFLKVIQPDGNLLTNEESKINHISHSNIETKNENDEEIHLPSRRINRNTRLNSTSKIDTDLIIKSNENSSETLNKPDLNHQDSFTRQISEGSLSIISSNDSSTTTNTLNSSSTFNMDRPLSLKKRGLTSSDIQALIDSTVSPSKNKTDQSIFNYETKKQPETLSSLSDILASPLLQSLNIVDDERKIANIESQLKTSTTTIVNNDHEKEKSILSCNSFETTIKPIESIDDEQPPSLISPTSMIISQSNHYNYSTRPKQQQQQINNFNPSTNMTYDYDNTSYPYTTYPQVPSYDMQSYYYPSTIPMDYTPYYPTSSSTSVYPPSGSIYENTSEPQSYYSSNDVNTISYNGNGTTPYTYPTPQPSSTVQTTQRH
ncbi:unnamed protein product [Rotaria sp. Silwood1]|nr:unnamed protein product [Rotaria sp. Silwood1]CAF1169549.1 unnamed protein product [Rotaria sp. Silwood1]CAF3474678.1 unnamed protein product [Rotaria sp. Silwood1]